MKNKAILVIYYLFIFNCCPGQYNPIFDHEHSMIMTYKFENLFGTTTDTLVFQKDTLIDEVIYMKFATSIFGTKNYYFREDTSIGIVSYFSDLNPIEKTIIDFSLELGDDFFVEGAWFPYPGYYQVDSVYYVEGRKHIQLNLPLYYAGNEKLTFIEGVGTNIGLTYKDEISGHLNPYLLCLWKDDEPAYVNTYYDGLCSLNSTRIRNEDVEKVNYFTIYPNPFTDKSQIDFSLQQATQVKIYITSIYGEKIKELYNNHFAKGMHNLIIDGSELQPGVYFCVMETETGHKTLKLIKM